MVQPLSERGMASYRRSQEVDILRRQEFLQQNRPTQEKIVNLLKKMGNFKGKKKEERAQEFFFRQTSKHRKQVDSVDKYGVDWEEVFDQITHSCFSNHEMDGYIIDFDRLGQSLSLYSALMSLE